MAYIISIIIHFVDIDETLDCVNVDYCSLVMFSWTIENDRGLFCVSVPLWCLWEHGQRHWGHLHFLSIHCYSTISMSCESNWKGAYCHLELVVWTGIKPTVCCLDDILTSLRKPCSEIVRSVDACDCPNHSLNPFTFFICSSVHLYLQLFVHQTLQQMKNILTSRYSPRVLEL
jgi:hypothetical protein